MNRRNLIQTAVMGSIFGFNSKIYAEDKVNKERKMRYIKLNDGVEIPQLGYGTWNIRGAKGQKAIEDALEVGYRHIDTARYYQNEDIVGQAVKNSGIKREEVFITTKLMWGIDADYKNTIKEFEKSLQSLKFDYVDLYLIHAPYGDIPEIWRAMIDLKNDGKIRSIGVSNFNLELVKKLSNSAIKPALNQIELHPFNQQKEMQEGLKKLGVATESYSPFGQGSSKILHNELLKKIADRYNKTVAQVILRWQIEKNIITIPKTATESRMIENIDIFDFELSQADIAEIESLD